MNICIIPARGGSKRIPRKNIKSFLGRPIIAYTIDAVLKSELFDEVMVSTDDPDIAKVAQQYGAKIPFYRSKENSGDFATTMDVIYEVLQEYKKLGKEFEYGCCCYPTAPFITPGRLREGWELLTNTKAYSVYPVVPFEYPVWKSFKMDANGYISFLWPQYVNHRSQDLMVAYHDAAQWYWFEVDYFMKTKELVTPRTKAVILDKTEAQDIDDLADWELAELKYKLFKQKRSR
ncbi:MAG: pseudaminic acid cytidylyltransferase [Bacteroidia bacterium]|nr:pseudaminic acid cytidylyltransferase [Bacteroidia bacterium]